MSKNGIEGVEDLAEELLLLAENAKLIASAGVCAAAGTIANGMRSQAPAEMRDYIGFRQIPSNGNQVRAVVGFGHGPKSKPRSGPPPSPQKTQRLKQIVETGANSTISAADNAMSKSAAARLNAILE